MNNEAFEAVTRARATLILDQPFFGALALRMVMQEDTSIKTLNVNGKVIRYNPTFFLNLSASLRKSALAHEVMHCVLDHLSRLGGRDPHKYNQAADYALNRVLDQSGFEIGENWLLDAAFDNMSSEQIYTLLPDAPSGGGGNGHGDPLDNMEPADPDPAQQAMDQQEWKIATIQAHEGAKIAGKMPANLDRFLTGLLSPKVDWRAVLRQFITDRSKDDYSWMRPNRNMLVHGVYLPSLYSENMGDIVLGIDVSGSIGQDIIDAFDAECQGIVGECLPANVHVVFCSSHIHKVDTFARYDEFKLQPSGSGGTAFKPVFDYVEEHDIKPVCLVYLTDLYGPTDFDPPSYPVLWACITEQVAPWGETVRIEL